MKRQVSLPNSNPQTTSSQHIQQLLISSVQTFLSEKRNIQISLPRLHSLIDKKVNLKVTSIPFAKDQTNIYISGTQLNFNTHQNRYKIIMQYIELLLSSSTLDLKAMEGFMGYFTKVIDNDIEIIQKNQAIRRNSFKIKEKLQFKVQQISKKTNVLNIAIEKLHDKQDIINFIALDIKNYLLSVKLISDEYEQVRMVQVHTPLKIDDIYEFQLSSQDDYNDHFQPLLQVLVRLRANMQNLFQNVKSCDRIDMPLKSVNLLANCKNLLTELQQYLISDRCAFNRLIFHVVTQQSQNMKLIASFYEHYLDYVRQLIFNVFKCVYQGHLFKGYYFQFGEQLKTLKSRIVELIKKIEVGDGSATEKRSQVFGDIEANLDFLDTELKDLGKKIKIVQKVLCFDKTTIMKFYLQEKICKKLGLLLTKKKQLDQLQTLLQQARKYIKQVKLIEQKVKQFPKIKGQIEKDIKQIMMSQSLKHEKIFLENIQSTKSDPYEKKFEENFLLIQTKNIQISNLQRSLKNLQPFCSEPELLNSYFPKLYEHTSSLKKKYSELESSLLESYQHMLADQTEKQAEANKNASETIRDIGEYLLSEDKDEEGCTYTTIGGEVLNQDMHCQAIKKGLQDIDRAQYMINSIRTKNRSKESIEKAKENIRKLQILRKYLQWLLVLYEGSMDDHILLNVVDKMDFNQASGPVIQKNMAKVQQLLKQVQKYNRELKRISRQIKGIKKQQKQEDAIYNKITNKMAKIIRDRQILYEIIQMLYGQFLTVYSDIKNPLKSSHKTEAYDFQTKGIQLFNKKLFDYALLCYHNLNKIAIVQKQLNDSNLIVSSKNFINDDLLEPYTNRLQSYLKFSEAEMLELTLGLEKAIRIQKQYKKQVNKMEEAIGQGAADQPAFNKLKSKCQQFVQIQSQINKISELGKKKFVILNIDDLKKIQKQCEEHFVLARQILQTQYSEVQKIGGQNKPIKNQKLSKVLKQFQIKSLKK